MGNQNQHVLETITNLRTEAYIQDLKAKFI